MNFKFQMFSFILLKRFSSEDSSLKGQDRKIGITNKRRKIYVRPTPETLYGPAIDV